MGRTRARTGGSPERDTPLPSGLHRLEATVAVYPPGHTSEAQLLLSRDVSGDVLQVSGAPG